MKITILLQGLSDFITDPAYFTARKCRANTSLPHH